MTALLQQIQSPDDLRRLSRHQLKPLADELGCSLAQLALSWLLHQGDDLIPIPGTTSVEHLMDDLGAVDVKLSADLMARVEALINERTVVGDRYNAQANSEVDTEVFA